VGPIESRAGENAQGHLQELSKQGNDPSLTEDPLDPDMLGVSQFPDLHSAFTVPIRMPTRDKLSVRLIPLEWLDRFEEYKDDQTEFLAVLGALCGGVLGVMVNVATGSFKSNPYSWAFLGILCLMSLLFLRFFLQTKTRAKKLKDEMLRSFGMEKSTEAMPERSGLKK
jgi:hypothetical protein